MNLRKMTVVLSAILAISVNAAWMLPVSAEERISGTCGDGVTWTVADGTLTIGGTGNMDDYDNYGCEFIGMQPVETKERPWERYSDTITSVVIEEGVTGIGNFAFSGLYYVETVHWADSLKHIGDYAFTSFNEYEVIQYEPFPAGLESIGDGAFFGQQYFAEHLELPQNLKSIGMAAFVFPKRTAWGSVTIPESVETIGDYAFGGEAKPYEGDVFEWLEDLSDAICYQEQPVSNFFTAMDGFTVYGNAHTAAQTYAEAHDFMFHALDTDAVSGTCSGNCTWKTEGDTLTISGEGELEGITGDPLEMAEEDFPQWWTDVTNVLEESDTTLKHLVVAEGITEIGDTAFPMDTFETITLPDSLTKIGDYAFGYFLEVSGELVLSENITEIGDAAFVCCPYSNITILNPDAVIGECAVGCSLDHRPESGAVLMDDFTITGYADSTAQRYAKEYGISFIALNTESPETTITETSTTEATTTTAPQTTTIIKNTSTSSPHTGNTGIIAFAIAGLTALLGSAICRKH